MIYGLDLLGIAKYPNRAKRAFPQGFALGAFSSAFGDARPAVDGVLSTGRCPRVRIHLMWKDNHKYSRRDFPAIISEAKKWTEIVQKYPNVEWNFSGACEHDLGSDDAELLANDVLLALPQGCMYVNTPGDGADLFAGINERHGTGAAYGGGTENFSYDGQSATKANIREMKQRFRKAETFFLWHCSFNGKTSDRQIIDRSRRTAWPDGKLIKSVAALARV